MQPGARTTTQLFQKSLELTGTAIGWTVPKAQNYEMQHRALLMVLQLIQNAHNFQRQQHTQVQVLDQGILNYIH